MSISVDLYDSRSLTEAVNIMKTPEPFVLNKIFGGSAQPHESDKIDFEFFSGSEEIATFAHSEAPEPNAISKLTKKVKTFSLPRTFESKLFTAQDLSKINAIGQIYSDSKVRKAEQSKYIAMELEALKNRVIRLKEKMACEAISTGKIVVDIGGMDYEYDFEFTVSQLFTNVAAKLWSATTSDPLVDIRTWRANIAKRSGVNAKYMILGTAAAEKFMSNEKVLKYLNNNNTLVGKADFTQDPTGSADFIGRIGGLDVYTYSQQYVEGGTAYDMIPTDRAIVLGDSANFRTHYGPSWRIENGVAVPKLAEYFLEVDAKSGTRGLQWNLEQKSLPTIHDPGLVITAKVV